MRPITNRGLIENILHYASAMAAGAAERALKNTWTNHPMFGIRCDKDEHAIAFQKYYNLLIQLLKDEGCDKA